MSILYGVGAALTLDEFALWLNLANVYWSREGRESIDAVVLFGSLLAIGTWGAPLYTAIAAPKIMVNRGYLCGSACSIHLHRSVCF